MSTMEIARPSAEKASLNSSRSQHSNDSRSSASELLSITDAAVSALSKTSNPKVNSYVSNVRCPAFQTKNRLLSPTDLAPDTIRSHDESGQLSDGSRSTTESEVLIRSTRRDSDAVSHHSKSNVSDQSKGSARSQTSSAFDKGRAQRVKMPSKKLKEINSPFVESAKNDETANRVKHGKHASRASDKLLNKEGTMHRDVRGSHYNHDVNTNSAPQTSESLQTDKRQSGTHQDPNTSDEHISNKETLPSTDSGYMTQAVKVVREKWPLQDRVDEEETPRDIPSMAEEISSEMHGDIPIDVIAKDREHQSSDTSASSGQPEIVTVQETVVTVRVTDGSISDRSTSLTSEGSLDRQLPCDKGSTTSSLEQRFSKFHTSHLRQGTLGASNKNDQLHTGQVQIAKTSLTEKEKQLKEAFCNRNPSVHAVKKHVIPTVVQRERNPAVDPKGSGVLSVNDAATTAAVAAASAVAATQPFLKAQQDVEMRIAQLMERIGDTQHGAQSTNSNNKVDELERQINDLTQHRIQYLEDMQKQQLQWQAQLLTMSRTADGRKVPPPGECYQHYGGLGGKAPSRVATRNVMSDDELGLNQYKQRRNVGVLQEKEKSVLDTPAPRAKPPTPTVLDESQRSEVRGHIIDHVTPDRKYKASGGLLAQILSQDGDTPQRSPFPATPQSAKVPSKRRSR